MGQILQLDRIGSLSHSAGTISLASSVLTIGGQQYSGALSRLIATDVTMTANTLYMIYAVINSGNMELRISANVNSVGPSGFTSWKLVGAFYANGLSTPAFGSFVNIEGEPTCEWIDFVGVVTASPTPPTKGTISTEKWKWRRVADTIEMFWDTVYTSAGTAGSGQYLHSTPTNLSIDLTKMGAGGNFVNFHCGTFSINTSTVSTSIGYMTAISSTGIGAVTYNGNIIGSSFGPYSAAAYNFSFRAVIPISGFTNTPLRNL